MYNVNANKRDSRDSVVNRFTLRVQYPLADHMFVHTEKMKRELIDEYSARLDRVTVIPFGINNSVPNTALTSGDARRRLGIPEQAKTILFFGRIAPYKGLEYLTAAYRQLRAQRGDCRLIIAGRPDWCHEYWRAIREEISDDMRSGRVLVRAEFIPDEDTEIHFKAADVCVLPYWNIYQTGVLFLAYSFGLPVLAADVGGLTDEFVEGKTGFVVRDLDPVHLANALNRYFESDLYTGLDTRRQEIREYAERRQSWEIVSQTTAAVYAGLLGLS